MYDVVASIVTYKNEETVLSKAINSFLKVNLNVYLYVVDNSPTDSLRSVCSKQRVEYIFNNKNLGFGSGHNIAIRKMIGNTKYSLILNPDVYFNNGVIEELSVFMESDKSVGLSMPKVLYPDGEIQRLCRLLPNPYDMISRRISPMILAPLFDAQRAKYELRWADYNKQMDVPYLSGCFMFVRTDIFEKIGLFDERFFIYFEDVDLSRRIHKNYRTVYYPQAVVYHGYQRDSCKNIDLFRHHILSGIKYFNKWGWFFDKERKFLNDKVVQDLSAIKK